MKRLSRQLAGWLCCALMPVMSYAVQTDLHQAVAQAQTMKPVPLLKREVVLKGSSVREIQLSPDGSKISYLRREGAPGRKLSSMWLYDIKNAETRKLFVFKNIRRSIWSPDGSGLFLDLGHSVAYSGIAPGDKPRLIAKLDTEAREKIFARDSSGHSSVIIRRWNDDKKQFALYRLSSQSKETLLLPLENEYSRLLLDEKGRPDVLMSQNQDPEGEEELMIFDAQAKKQKPLWQCDWADECRVLYFDRKGNRLLMATNRGGDLVRLVWANMNTGALEVVHQDPLNFADLSYGTEIVKANGTPVLVSYHGHSRLNYGLTEQMDEHVKFIEGQLGREMLFFHLPDTARLYQSHWLVMQGNNRQAKARVYLYHPASKRLTRPLKNIIDQADSEQQMMFDDQLAPKFSIHYPTSDGYSVQGYLTLPRGTAIKEAPLVVKVHGGPWARVNDGVDRGTQLLANRGYIVFEPNFRASKGFGKKHMTSIKHDYGDGRVHKDITEGVLYLLDNGIGDKDKVGIIGHSFGGFSTLTGLAVTPELYKVGFAGAPPTDMGRSAKLYYRFQKKVNSSLRSQLMKQLVVDWEDKKALAVNSLKQPMNLVDKITKPLVMWAGKNDRRVFIVDVNDYATKAESLNKKISLFVDNTAMHSPSGEAARMVYMYLMEKTLAMHLGGKLQALDKAQDKQLYRNLQRQMKMDHVGVMGL